MDRLVLWLDRVHVYLDDMLIASADMGQHLQDLTNIFFRLKQAGLFINVKKCLFATPELDFLA